MNRRYIYISIITITITGCMPHFALPSFNRTQPTIQKIEDNNTQSIKRFGSTKTFNPNVDESYTPKPEPYSLASQEKDPELLGPQSTLKNNPLKGSSDEELETEDYDTNKQSSRAQIISEVYDNALYIGMENNPSSPLCTLQKSSHSITKSECIGMLGVDKFNEYVKRYGGESAAIRRCAILKRLNS